MAALYDYMNEEELMIAQESAMINNEGMKFDNQFQILALEHEMRLHDIDTKALLDNYTEAVLEDAYLAELQIYEEGVKEAWEKFKAWFIQLINKILGKTAECKNIEIPQEEKSKKIKVPFKLQFVTDKIKEIANGFKDIFKNADGSLNKGTTTTAIIGVAAGGLAAFTAAKALKKHVEDENVETEVNAESLQEAAGIFESSLQKIKSIFGQHKHEENDSTAKATESINIISKIVNIVKEKITSLVSAAKNGAEKAADAASDAASNVKSKAAVAASKINPNRNNGKSDDVIDPTEVGESASDSLLDSLEDIEFMQESGLDDMLLESVSMDDINEISDIIESL